MKFTCRLALLALLIATNPGIPLAFGGISGGPQIDVVQPSHHSGFVRESGRFLTLQNAPLNTYNSPTLKVSDGNLSIDLKKQDHYRGLVAYTGRDTSDIMANNLIFVMREDKSFMALYPEKNQLIYSNKSGQQTRLTFSKPVFNVKDFLAATQEERPDQLTIKKGGSFRADRDEQGNVVIDILAGFSDASAKTIIDHEAFAFAQLTTVNQALRNSEIDKIRVRLVGTQIIKQDFPITQDTLSKISTLFKTGIEEFSPDLVTAFFEGNDADTAIGWGYVNDRYTVNALYASTSLRHEIGHNMGGGHCPPGNDDAYGWDNGKTKTIQCGNNIGYYSTPLLKDNYGLAIGKTGVANMSRVWRDNAEKVSAYSPSVVPIESEDAHLIKQQSVTLDASNNFLQPIEFNVPKYTRQLVISAVSGPQHEELSKFSLYLCKGKKPSTNDYDFASREHWNTFLGVHSPSAGKWHLAVTSGKTAVKDIIIRVVASGSEQEVDPGEKWPDSLQNADAEAGNLVGWHLDHGQFRAVTGQDGIKPYSGKYFFTARINDAEAGHADKDQLSQTIAIGSEVKTKLTATLKFMSNGWGDGDYGTVSLIALDENGRRLKVNEVQTKGEFNKWLKNQLSLDLPVGTALLHLKVQATRKAGSTSDVHFDDFALKLNSEWARTTTYDTPCETVTYQGKVWKNGWWTRAIAPGSDGPWGVWRSVDADNMHDKCE